MPDPTSTSGREAPTRASGNGSGSNAGRPGPSSRSSATQASSPLELEERARAAEAEEEGSEEAEKGLRGLDDQLAAINELLGGPQAAKSEEDAPDQPEGEKPATDPLRGADGKFRAKSLSEVAEHLDLKPEELYGLELTTGDGETVRLGDLKDAWQDRRQAARETAERESGLDEREAALRGEQALWEPILAELRDKVPEGFKARLRGQAESHQARERTRLLEAIPELADQAHFDTWRGEVVEFLTGYGFAPREMAVTDHRMLVILRDHMRLKARLAKLMAYEPERDPPQASRPQGRKPQGNSRARQLVETARRSGRQQDQLAAISGLIDGR